MDGHLHTYIYIYIYYRYTKKETCKLTAYCQSYWAPVCWFPVHAFRWPTTSNAWPTIPCKRYCAWLAGLAARILTPFFLYNTFLDTFFLYTFFYTHFFYTTRVFLYNFFYTHFFYTEFSIQHTFFLYNLTRVTFWQRFVVLPGVFTHNCSRPQTFFFYTTHF